MFISSIRVARNVRCSTRLLRPVTIPSYPLSLIRLNSTIQQSQQQEQQTSASESASSSPSSGAENDQGSSKFLGKTFQSPERELSIDEKYDLWLDAVKELRQELNSKPWNPETALAPPGQGRVNLLDSKHIDWTPTEEQIAEKEALSKKDLPLLNDEVVEHCINIIMRNGKKQQARKYLSQALYLIYLQLRTNPVLVLKDCLDKLGPLITTRTLKTGFAKNVTIPSPLNKKQRDRIAFTWMLEGSDKRASHDFSVRLSEEILSVHEGKSSGFEKRQQMHRAAALHRAFLKLN
ncbi:hypothetical protein PACTADRAFT_44127 [Pachysolen tannophilus NRRL Y-2460]|uniref:Small ribosomal subunit protein uS7 domain-containing protein n=1 Tax=Pachysolen tannophilus NRRL Y-2460 TaxID=669874 RepID=A0A1E4TT16_PACTA|nr:hypothetical protein PACTADRAFT_44127 [Pachysolen tannophilus NRRL Y-2460]